MTITSTRQAHALDGEIRLVGAGKSYLTADGRTVRGLAPIDLVIEPGTFVAIIGRSGCGKSTLLRLAAGLERSTAGVVLIDRSTITSPPASVRYVFQNFGDSLLPWKTVLDNVRFGVRHAFAGTRAAGRDAQRELATSALAEVGLTGIGDRYPSELSGGMQQRVAIARALASQPRILLMDEPFSAVDALSRAKLQDLVLNLWQEHALTVVFVTHDVEEALYLADRVVVLGAEGAGILADITVDLPRPRTQIETRENPRFLELRRAALDLVLG